MFKSHRKAKRAASPAPFPDVFSVPVYNFRPNMTLRVIYNGYQTVCDCGWRSGIYPIRDAAITAFFDDHLSVHPECQRETSSNDLTPGWTRTNL